MKNSFQKVIQHRRIPPKSKANRKVNKNILKDLLVESLPGEITFYKNIYVYIKNK